jgi:hypothetical protein
MLVLSAHPETDVANGFAAEAFFQFSQDFDLRRLFEFVVQRRLKAALPVRATLVSRGTATQILVIARKPTRPAHLDVMARALRLIAQ